MGDRRVKLTEAPRDGNTYGRKDGDWVTLALGGSPAWGDITGTLSDQTDLQTALDTKLEDAPSDGTTYGRLDGAWSAINALPSGTDEYMLRYNGSAWEATQYLRFDDGAGADAGMQLYGPSNTRAGMINFWSRLDVKDYRIGCTSDTELQVQALVAGNDIIIEVEDDNDIIGFRVDGFTVANTEDQVNGGFEIFNQFTGNANLPERALTESDFSAGGQSGRWRWSTSTGSSTSAFDIQLDDDFAGTVTTLYVDDLTIGSVDQGEWIQEWQVNDVIYICDVQDRTDWCWLRVTSVPSDTTSEWSVGVEVIDYNVTSGNSFPNNAEMLLTVYPHGRLEQRKNSSTINNKTGNYTIALADEGETIRFTSGTNTLTIDSNANVAMPVGTLIGVVNDSGNNLSIAITTDTLEWVKDNTSGTRTLADGGSAVLQKVDTTLWKIAGSALLT
jgi:hypothetical protein